eukprot:TRINITY_DN26065_c0_g1_i1.p1 TRINITY_DN26065_c0_g1~~TRINITY_DN26065_c0_g1_i1.p1  ORF type:complete len:389 (-),score=41.79 TRINITY_DN26065_c0_g1_i1:151-1317(-)
MTSGGGFQPCVMDTRDIVPVASWERKQVALALMVHILDVGLDLLVVFLFAQHMQWGLLASAAGVILWSWVVSSLYISFGGGAGSTSGDIDDAPSVSWQGGRLRSFVQVQIFAEAYRCIVGGGDTDYFHTLRLMEAILESAPSTLVKLYALIVWSCDGTASEWTVTLLRGSAYVSFLSVGLGLAFWEQKVQSETSRMYILLVSNMRVFEIASRSLTLAIFASLTRPTGLCWALAVDYVIMLLLIVRHKSVQVTYGLFVALPLVLVSLEPFVWRRDDHAVPKDLYYGVRVLETIVMWIVIHYGGHDVVADDDGGVFIGCKTMALFYTFCMYTLLPFVLSIARKLELARDQTEWDGYDSQEGLHADGSYCTDSDVSSNGSACGEELFIPGE